MASAISLFRSFLTLSFGNVAAQFLMLIAFAAIGRQLGPSDFGWWSFSYVLMLYLFRLNEFGLEVMGVRAIASGRAVPAERISLVLGTRFILAILLFLGAVLACVVGIIPGEARLLVVLFSLAVFPVALTIEWAYEAIQQFQFVSVARITKSILFVGFVLLGMHGASASITTAIIYGASLAVPVVYLLADSRRRFGEIRLDFNWAHSKGLLKESLPVGLATFLSQYALFFATTFLGYVDSAANVGFFAAAQRLIVFVWAYGIVASNRVVLPTLSRLHRDSEEAFNQFVVKATRLFILVALPIGVLGTIASSDLIDLVYGTSFASSSGSFRVLLWVLVIAVSRSPFEISYWASDRQWIYVRRMLLLAAAHTVAVPVGYIMDGIRGVAIGMFVAEAFYTVFLIFRGQIMWPRSILGTVARALLASAVAFVIAAVGALPIVISVVVCGLAYVATLVVAGEFTREDRAMVLGLFNWRQSQM
jgi:O-antigen/teichoic acid export membrane protein